MQTKWIGGIAVKKNANFILKLIFSLMGTVYAVMGSIFLLIAIRAAGDLRQIFTLPEDELVFAILGVVFMALGLAFLLTTFILILAGKRQQRLREELLQYGTRVKGTVTDVRVDHTVRVNGCSPLVAKVSCTLPTGEVTLKSKRLWNACPATGDQVEVIYDPMDEKRYVIEFGGEM